MTWVRVSFFTKLYDSWSRGYMMSLLNLLGCWFRVKGSHQQVTYPFDHVVGKIKTFYIHFHKSYKHQTWRNRDLGWEAPSPQIPATINHVVKWYHITNYFISSSTRRITNKFSLVKTSVTLVDCIDKSKMLYLLFHKIYGHETLCDHFWGNPSYYQVILPLSHIANEKLR